MSSGLTEIMERKRNISVIMGGRFHGIDMEERENQYCEKTSKATDKQALHHSQLNPTDKS